MRKNIIHRSLLVIITIILFSCEDWLDKHPYDVVSSDEVWTDITTAEGVLANLYDRLNTSPFDKANMQLTDEAMWSGDRAGLNDIQNIPSNQFEYWDYTYIRDLNLFIEKAQASSLDNKKQLEGEGRFLRAYTYFEMVKRFGGVPLVIKSYVYDENTPIENYQPVRETEAGIYDFIASEIDDIVSQSMLPETKNFRRANKWSALALKSRAMLYAGSIAKYNSQMADPVTLPNGEVGIPANQAQKYYQASWDAGLAIIKSELYSTSTDYFAIFDKKSNDAMIMARDYVPPKYTHDFSITNTTPSLAQTTNQGGEITPFLEFVENYQTLDGKIEKLKDKTPDGSPVYYESMANIFANRDKRLAATVLYSGSEFKGKVTSIQAGQKVWNQQTGNYDYITGMSLGDKDENELLIRGFDGPSEDKNITNTGFYLKKFVSTSSDAGLSAVKASNYWPIFRYAEILLNTAEAGFELGKPQAIDYINAIREDAGFGPNSLVSLTFEDIIQERKVELAFEGHRYFDLKRWRLSEKIINGVKYHGLYPYLIVHPGNENHLKYTFERVDLKRLSRYKVFERTNYYTFIPGFAIEKNPKLVKNPGQ